MSSRLFIDLLHGCVIAHLLLKGAFMLGTVYLVFQQMPNISPDQADTYKCFATNEFGKAVVTVVLNVIAGRRKCVLYKVIIFHKSMVFTR